MLSAVVDQPIVSGWSLDKGYVDITNTSSYPIHVYGSQERAAFTIHLQGLADGLEYLCRDVVSSGFKVYLHTPGDVLRSTDPFDQVWFDEHVSLAITPKTISTAGGLRTYRPSQRRCFFTSERPLRFYTIYTQHNCEVECLANYTVQECGCVKFSMPS